MGQIVAPFRSGTTIGEFMMKKTLAVAALMSVAFAGAAEARDQIRIVGSSTVFPFATAVAEEFGKTTSFKTPVIESTGSGGGLKLFCAGVGEQHPDITNASRFASRSPKLKLVQRTASPKLPKLKSVTTVSFCRTRTKHL